MDAEAAAVPDVHERHDGQAQRAASTAPAATSRTSPAPRSTTRTSIPRTSTGAWPTSAGSPATPTSSTGRWRSAATSVLYEGVPELSGCRPAVAHRRAARRQHLPHLADGDPHAAQDRARTSRAKYNYHFKHMTTVGEPIEPEAWRWYHEVGRQGRGGHRRHLVADRDRRLPDHDQAGARSDEAGQRRPAGARHLSR